MIFLYSAWAVGLVLLVVNKVFHFARGEHILAQLPLHLCYVSLIFFIPMALRFKKKIFYDFIFYVNSVGALMALIFPAKDYVVGIWSAISISYMVFHYIIFCIPIWLFLWKIYSAKITVLRSLVVFGVLAGLSMLAHGLNILLVHNGITAANYFWTMTANAQYNVSILKFFASVIPYDYLYIVAFAIPCLALYICSWKLGMWSVHKIKLRLTTRSKLLVAKP